MKKGVSRLLSKKNPGGGARRVSPGVYEMATPAQPKRAAAPQPQAVPTETPSVPVMQQPPTPQEAPDTPQAPTPVQGGYGGMEQLEYDQSMPNMMGRFQPGQRPTFPAPPQQPYWRRKGVGRLV